MEIRHIQACDAEKFASLIKQVESESKYLLFEPGERSITIAKQSKMIRVISQEDNSTIFIAENNSAFVGYLIVFGGNAKRNRHSAYLVIGILESFRGIGVGTKLFIELEKWAIEQNLHRLELSVVNQNEEGLGLYKKMGFEMEGIKRHSLLIDGQFYDEYFMSKLL
ncbi:GNAT family N-acetyltransferase [Aquibacillus saliphilus]|uniref:GNAT family N-acetyltransferase n=1 Tax=Aquibacillus saliphilus TaxID=1909422 RepID=UPI001CEFBAB2|nr:GNAT family N-acetyltransferase [Aquibacillus saliphilus]